MRRYQFDFAPSVQNRSHNDAFCGAAAVVNFEQTRVACEGDNQFGFGKFFNEGDPSDAFQKCAKQRFCPTPSGTSVFAAEEIGGGDLSIDEVLAAME
jgi:hypothetical protein